MDFVTKLNAALLKSAEDSWVWNPVGGDLSGHEDPGAVPSEKGKSVQKPEFSSPVFGGKNKDDNYQGEVGGVGSDSIYLTDRTVTGTGTGSVIGQGADES